jgi:antitoxin ParD1/3/4
MEQTHIDLSPELSLLVQKKIAHGHYASVDEVISEALRLLDQYDLLREANLKTLRAAIQEGIDSGTGGSVDLETIVSEAKAGL